jgi:hypothetical protein
MLCQELIAETAVCPFDHQVLTVSKLPGSLIKRGFRFRADRPALAFHHLCKFANVEDRVAYQQVSFVHPPSSKWAK